MNTFDRCRIGCWVKRTAPLLGLALSLSGALGCNGGEAPPDGPDDPSALARQAEATTAKAAASEETTLTADTDPPSDAPPVEDPPAIFEPNPCQGRGDGGSGGDYYNGPTVDGQWSKRYVYGTWYNCGGTPGQADRVQMDISTDTDGPCITVPYGSTGSSGVTRLYRLIPPHFRGWKRC
jgi:hypothetical protein